MSVAPVTTVQQPNTPITTTTVNPTSSNQEAPPALRTRPAGWHAKSFGFDWNKRSDQHKYLVKSGLPEVHAAIVNDDWDLALELICPEDLGLLWLPPASQRPPQNGHTDLDPGAWTNELASNNEDTRNNAILQMALHTTFITSVGDNCLYGANLLNLCLLKPARPDVLQYVITLAAKHAPQYLNLPDALGRTPLWVAIDNQDQASIQLLLKAGANPLQACKFSEQGEPKSPLFLAANYPDKAIFRDLLLATIGQGKKFTSYNFNEDPLYLKRWASGQSSEDVLWMVDQVKALQGPLLCCEDISGSSYCYRSAIDGSLDNTLTNGNEDLIEWLRKLDTSPAVSDDVESTLMFAAASQASIHTYLELDDFFSYKDEQPFCKIDIKELQFHANKEFFLRWTVKEFDQYLDSQPELLESSKSNKREKFIEVQLNTILDNYSELNFDDYARAIKSVWPFITDDNKNVLFSKAASSTKDHMEIVLGLLDCELEPSKIESILILSGAKRNTVAFEFAADRSLEMVQILKSLRAGNDTGYDMFVMALTARSLKWVEQLINAGFNLQQAINDAPSYISVLADIDSQGLAQKLKGLNYVITPRRIEQAETEAGKQALKALMKNAT